LIRINEAFATVRPDARTGSAGWQRRDRAGVDACALRQDGGTDRGLKRWRFDYWLADKLTEGPVQTRADAQRCAR